MRERLKKTVWENYMKSRRDVYKVMLPQQIEKNFISEANWMLRARYRSGEEMGVRVKPGDICFVDFGQSYLNEMGYQHFGLVVSVCNKKALMIPMTSNPVTYARAYDEKWQPHGKYHLMKIGLIPGLNKPSVLFLNDIRFVNTARVIDKKAEIDVNSVLFHRIQERLYNIVFNMEY